MEGSGYRRWGIWAAVATIGLPVVMILLVAVVPDEGAIATSTILDDLVLIWLIAVALGLGPLAILWSIRTKRTAVRRTVLALCAFAGFIVGLIGSVGISIARQPTWDDA